MRTIHENISKQRTQIPYESESLKDGNFTKSELSQYGLSDDEISIILDYCQFYKKIMKIGLVQNCYIIN